jgi:hypothetical protein
MGYRKRYEDSYLDEDEKDTDELGKTDSERIVVLLGKPSRTLKEEEKVKLLTQRLFNGAKMPGAVGADAVSELAAVAKTYADLGVPDEAVAIWAQIGDIAGATGNKELYYQAMDEMTNLNSAVYEEHHPGDGIQ